MKNVTEFLSVVMLWASIGILFQGLKAFFTQVPGGLFLGIEILVLVGCTAWYMKKGKESGMTTGKVFLLLIVSIVAYMIFSSAGAV